jgi:hypothetical protein
MKQANEWEKRVRKLLRGFAWKHETIQDCEDEIVTIIKMECASQRTVLLGEMVATAQKMQKHNEPFKKDWEFIEMFIKSFGRK